MLEFESIMKIDKGKPSCHGVWEACKGSSHAHLSWSVADTIQRDRHLATHSILATSPLSRKREEFLQQLGHSPDNERLLQLSQEATIRHGTPCFLQWTLLRTVTQFFTFLL